MTLAVKMVLNPNTTNQPFSTTANFTNNNIRQYAFQGENNFGFKQMTLFSQLKFLWALLVILTNMDGYGIFISTKNYCIYAKDVQLQGRKNVFKQINPLPHDKILDWSKLNQILDNILKCI